MITVSDSSPLIFLAKINCLDLLKKLFHKVSIPHQVYIDVVVEGKTKPGGKEVNKAINDTWIEVIEIKELEEGYWMTNEEYVCLLKKANGL